MAIAGESSRFRVGLIVAAVLLCLFALPMIRGQVFVHDDLAYYFLPLRRFYASTMARGEDPAWCPNLFGGFFLYGEGGGLAHPLVRFLYETLPLDLALNVEMLASYPALFAGFFALLMRWGVRRDAAVFGGILFAFGGYNLLHFMHLSVMAMLAHVPWLLLAIDVALRSSDPRRMALARVAFSLLTLSQMLLGHVQFAWISSVGEVFYAAFLAFHVPGAARRLPGLAVSKILGVLAASIQILPLWKAFSASKREQPTPTFIAMGSLPPANLIQWIAPYLSVSRVVTPPMPIDGGVLAPAPSMYDWRVHEFAMYYGAAIPALLIWLVMVRKSLGRLRPLALLAGLLVLVTLLLAFGDYTPLFQLSTKVPVIGRFRIPARYLVLVHLSVAMLGAVAFASLVNRSSQGERLPWRRLWPLVLPPLLSVLACLAPRLPEGVWPSYLRGPFLASTGLLLAGPLLVGIATALVALSARGSKIAAMALFAFVAADQAAYGAQMMALNPPRSLDAFLDARPVPPGDAGLRVVFDRLHETNHNPYTMKGLRLIQGYVALMPKRQLIYDRPSSLRVAGVGWRMPSDDERGQPWVPVPDPLPRARLVSRTKTSDDPNRDLDTIDVATTALVPGDIVLPPSEPGRAKLVGDRPGKLDVMTETGSRQLLVVSESYHDGWRVRIDGKTHPLLRVNGDFMGCVVPEGKHHVQLRFRPRSLWVGPWLSALGLVLSVAVPLLPLAGVRGVASVLGRAVPASHLGVTRAGVDSESDRVSQGGAR